MKKLMTAMICATTVSACGGDGTNPLTTPPVENDLPPGTTLPSAGSSIERYEEEDGSGNGYAQSITYDKKNNTFTVDNLAFDGDNTYRQDARVRNLGSYRVYENDAVFKDSVTGSPINQFPHKAIYGVSKNTNEDGQPVTQFAIVRTGAYAGYGFGGFMYQREGGVVIPKGGQAHFSGDYAGVRDFTNAGGLEYTTGDMIIDIDFEDFNAGAAVSGHVTNRKILNLNGEDITSFYENALGVSVLPSLNFAVGSGALDSAGEITGGIGSYVGSEVHESGTYYAVLAGEGADMEVTGVIVVTSENPFDSQVEVRETGGFILYR